MEAIQQNFVGKWKLDRSENLDAVLAEMGMNAIKRKAASAASPTQYISIEGDNIKVVIDATIKKEESLLKLDETVENKVDGEVMKLTATFDGSKLVVNAEPADSSTKRKPLTSTREIVNGELVMTLKVNGVEGKRIFKKA